MDRSSEDALWRSIVENYGERVDLDRRADHTGDHTADRAGDTTGGDAVGLTGTADAQDVAAPDTTEADADPGQAGQTGQTGQTAGAGQPADGAEHEVARAREAEERGRAFDAAHEIPDRFVPPEPPPLPYVEPSRLAAWALLVAGPLLLLASLVLGYPLPGVVQFLAAGGFVGGFVYLVVRMPRDPRDPWDDGARV